MDNQWYDNSSEASSGWYDPAPERAAGAAPAKAKPRRRGWIPALIITLLILALIVVTALLFGSRGEPSSSSGVFDPPAGDGNDFAEDFRDFFESYYTPWEETEDCLIPTVDGFEDVVVELRPAGERELTLHEIYEKCAPSVVAVTAFIDERSNDSYYWGTGIVLTEDGYIVTNAHVVAGSVRARVTLWNDEEYDVLLVGYDTRSDIAVLKIDARGLVPAEFCDAVALAVGDHVVAIGNPLGREFRSTMTEGIISGIDRDVSYNGTSQTLLQTSAPINEGNSGGPLINMYGQVIGITNMKMSNSAGAVTIEGVGFAIPSRTVKTMADSILATGEVRGRPALGVTLGPIPDSARSAYDLPEGLYVSEVNEDSDCHAKGIRTGDIITAVNGQPVTETAQLSAVINQLSVGDTLTLTIWRSGGDGEPFDVTVSLVDFIDVF